jgi:hypothetical protein
MPRIVSTKTSRICWRFEGRSTESVPRNSSSPTVHSRKAMTAKMTFAGISWPWTGGVQCWPNMP